MQSFEYYCPTEIIFGKGAESKVAEKIHQHGGKNVMIIYGGGSAVKSGLLAKIERHLMAGGFTALRVLGGVKPNPRVNFAREGVREALAANIDFILAVGGGSVIDTAKAVAIGAANPGIDIWDFWQKKYPVEKSLPVGVVLTIAAAGSESSDSAVLTDEESGKKAGLTGIFNRPAFAIMNPEMTYTVPKYPLICGISDIIMHTLERYFSNIEGNEFTDLVAESLMKNVINQSKIVINDTHDYDAMSEIMWCGSVSHTGFTGLGRDRDFSAHKLGHELGGRYDVAHGASLTTMWAWWARTVYTTKPERFARLAENIFGVTEGSVDEKANAFIDKLEQYFKEIGMPTNFTELGIGVQKEDELKYLANMCTSNGTKEVATFKPMNFDLVLEIYKKANH